MDQHPAAGPIKLGVVMRAQVHYAITPPDMHALGDRIKVLSSSAFSCNQCASVWVSGALATVAMLALAVATGNWTWLLWWPLVAPAAAGLAARLFL